MGIVRAAAHDLAAECDRLITIADGMPAVSERRRLIAGQWYAQLLDLTQATSLETPSGERALDELVLQLRRAWMATAHEHADDVPVAGRRSAQTLTLTPFHRVCVRAQPRR